MRMYTPVSNLVEREVKQDYRLFLKKNSEINISLIQNNQDIILLFTIQIDEINCLLIHLYFYHFELEKEILQVNIWHQWKLNVY
ncbi:unnamed protein product [Paramecium pentaurelia]|uniref:Uncharacterized protein n=1 Tax=Paramecium pentaurelia TaxID=43138 RepID=A0A8S1V6K7_9CILI|nr:unnamed protein product [Paramecium pentaurelia]